MNRLVIIGNGFDLAHGLNTSYNHFYNFLWEKSYLDLKTNLNDTTFIEYVFHFGETVLNIPDKYPLFRLYVNTENINKLHQTFINKTNNEDLVNYFKLKIKDIIENRSNSSLKIEYANDFFKHIIDTHNLNGWIDFENEFFNILMTEKNIEKLNIDFNNIKELLKIYLIENVSLKIDTSIFSKDIDEILHQPISSNELNNFGKKRLFDYSNSKIDIYKYDKNQTLPKDTLEEINTIASCEISKIYDGTFKYPADETLILNFNYTDTEKLYIKESNTIKTIHIHGTLQSNIIFGHGDETAVKYKEIEDLDNNLFFKHIKSFQYLNDDNYKEIINFIEDDLFQVCIIGHSCGLSDRVLLSTIFEHPNCISIKPFYYTNEVSDSYQDTVMNISRNFTNKIKMRELVVNKKNTQEYSKTKKL